MKEGAIDDRAEFWKQAYIEEHDARIEEIKGDRHKAACIPDGLLEEWQKRLGLTDWRIKLVDNCEPEDMSLRDVAGSTEWTESVKTARIEIMDPKFYGDRIVPFDYEKTLVHELLHLKFSLISLDTSELQARIVHQIIDDLARAFVDAKRSGEHEPSTSD